MSKMLKKHNMILISHDHISKSQGGGAYFHLGVKESCKVIASVYESMTPACAEPVRLLCDKFGKEKLRNGTCSLREARKLEGHEELWLREPQMRKPLGPTSTQRKRLAGKQGPDRQARSVPADSPVSTALWFSCFGFCELPFAVLEKEKSYLS